MSLLQQAKEVKVKGTKRVDSWNDEHLELVIAYLNEEVTNKQMTVAANRPGHTASNFVGSVLMWAVRNKKLVPRI